MTASKHSATEDLGAFLLKSRLITGAKLAECLKDWLKERAAGNTELLHELLVKRGVISLPGLQRLLDQKNAFLASCPSCGRARVAPSDRMDWCAECQKPYQLLDIRTQHEGRPASRSVAARAGGGGGDKKLQVQRYEVLKLLGKGGMGEVYLAHDPVCKSNVALKFLSLDISDSQIPFKRFAREGRLLANLQHPNLVSVLDVNLTSDPPYLVMEFVEGQNLDSYLSRGYAMNETIEMVAQAADGVAAVHDQGIIHRDLKPANILITPTGVAKVTDFGLAKVMDSNSMLTRTGQSIGTPAFMAPEQIRGDLNNLGPSTDVYAMGVILYRVLSGQLPFEGMTMTEILRRSLKEDIPAPHSTTFKIPPAMSQVCQRATRNQAAERYQTARAFLEDLREAIRSPNAKLKPAPAPAASTPRADASGGRRWVVVLAILAAVAAVAGVALSQM